MKRLFAVVFFLCFAALLLSSLPVAPTAQGQETDIVYVSQDDPACGGNSPCYASIQEAFDAISKDLDGVFDPTVIPSFSVLVTSGYYWEDLSLNAPVNVDFEGGWNSDFTAQTGNTYISSLTIGEEGSLAVGNIIMGSPSGPPPPIDSFEGTYSGTYSGTDYGTWTVRCDSKGNVVGSAWSEKNNTPDVGSGSVTSSGEFHANMYGGAILSGTIDSTGGAQGTWTNPDTGQSGSLQGQKNNPDELAAFGGKYAGNWWGTQYTDSGIWWASINFVGICTASYVWSKADQKWYWGDGIVNSSGEFIATVSNGSSLHGIIDSIGDVTGSWHYPSGKKGGYLSGERTTGYPSAPF